MNELSTHFETAPADVLQALSAERPASIDEVLALPSFLSGLRNLAYLTGVRFEELPLATQDRIVLDRLSQLVHIATLNPAWKERLALAGVSGDIASVEDFEAIPLTDKDTFRAFFTGERPGLVVPVSHCGFQVVASGGTSSGAPSETVYSLQELQDTYDFAGEFMGRHLMPRYLGKDGPKWVATTLADYQMWSSGTMVGGVLQKIPGVNYIGAGPVNLDVYRLMMSYPGPKAIMGITGSIALLASFAEGLDETARASLHMALYGSGMLTQKTRQDLKAAYPNLAILSYFAATQAETIGLQLVEDSPYLTAVPGLHFIEIVDENGKAVAPGEEGELVVTRLHANAAPVLRYKVGDRVIRRPDLVSKGLNALQFEYAGRSGDFMHIGDTQYNARQALDAVIAEFRQRDLIDLDKVASELQILVDRNNRRLILLVATPDHQRLHDKLAAALGPEGAAPIIIAGLVRSLSVFNSLEANEPALRRSGYLFGIKLIDPSSKELTRTEVGKVPLLVDRI